MSCAINIDHVSYPRPLLAGLIARPPMRWTSAGPFRRTEISGVGHQDNLVRDGLPDSVNTDPTHVWGDEGPVND
jgi:hypothetical protein